MAVDTAEIRKILSSGYNDFQNHGSIGLPAVLKRIHTGHVQSNQQAARSETRGRQLISQGNDTVMGTLEGARSNIKRREEDSIENIRQSVENAFEAFGRTPGNIGGPPVHDFSGLQPALTQAMNRSGSQFMGQGKSLGREVDLRETQQQSETDEAMMRLAAWRKLKELEGFNKYQNQRDAVDREKLGAGVEKGRLLANLLMQQGM